MARLSAPVSAWAVTGSLMSSSMPACRNDGLIGLVTMALNSSSTPRSSARELGAAREGVDGARHPRAGVVERHAVSVVDDEAYADLRDRSTSQVAVA